MLRPEVAVLRRGNPKPRLDWTDRAIGGRACQKRKWTQPRSPGRTPISDELAALTVTTAAVDESRGHRRVQGELRRLGHRVDAATIRRILRAHRPPPAPRRADDTAWRTFLRAHADTPPARDFFHVGSVNPQGVRVFFVLDVRNRYVHIPGATANPAGAWTTQLARNSSPTSASALASCATWSVTATPSSRQHSTRW